MANNEKLAIGIKDEDNVLYRFIPPAASDSNVGGIKASPKTTQTQEVKIDPTTNRLYVDDPTDDIANVTGNLTNLHTTNKQNLVGAINEVNDAQTNIKEDLTEFSEVTNSRIDAVYSESFTITSDNAFYGYVDASGIIHNSSTHKYVKLNAEGMKKITYNAVTTSGKVLILIDNEGNISSYGGGTTGANEFEVHNQSIVYINLYDNIIESAEIHTIKIAKYEDLPTSEQILSEVIEYNTGNNLANPDNFEVGCYYDYRTGERKVSGSSATERIKINAGEIVWINKFSHHICFFDENEEFIEGYLQQTQSPFSVTVPENTDYLIVSGGEAAMTELMINTGEYAKPYEPYIVYKSLKDDIQILQSNHYKPYESGFIPFKVKSRLTKSNNNVTSNQTSEGTDDSEEVTCIIKLPTSYSNVGVPTPLIMICHGAGQSAVSWSSNTNYQALVAAFNNAGYAVFDCNGFRENALGYSFWGDSRGVDVWRKAYQYVVNNYNVEHQFGLYGFSMGGLTALNLMFSGFPNIKCVALGSPVVSLEACYNSESVNAVIKALYGMGDVYDQTLAYGCDPYSKIVNINDTKYIFGNNPPIKIWYGSTETGTSDTGTGEVVTGVVVKAYGHDIVNAINNAGGQAEYREVEGAGHEICYGGNSAVNSDVILYFNRHMKLN